MIPWFQYITVYIGPIPIQVWGFFVALGIVCGSILMYRLVKRHLGKTVADKAMDLATYTIVSAIVFSRIFHIVFYNLDFFLADPLEILRVWHGGFSSYGGFFGALLVIFWYYKKKHFPQKMHVYEVLDYFAIGTLVGWIIGRIGCFMIHDHMGKPCDCFLAIQTPDGPRLEMALLEILCLLPLAIVFYLLYRRKMPQGFFLALLGIYYGVVRFVLDFFRATDIFGADARYFSLTPAQYFSIIVLLVSANFMRLLYKRA